MEGLFIKKPSYICNNQDCKAEIKIDEAFDFEVGGFICQSCGTDNVIKKGSLNV